MAEPSWSTSTRYGNPCEGPESPGNGGGGAEYTREFAVTYFFVRPGYIRKQEKTEVQGLHHPTLCRFVPLRPVQSGLLSPCPVVPTDS